MKASILIQKLKDACAKAGHKDLEVFHWSGYEPRATRNFHVDFEKADATHNLYTHYGAGKGEYCIVLDVSDD